MVIILSYDDYKSKSKFTIPKTEFCIIILNFRRAFLSKSFKNKEVDHEFTGLNMSSLDTQHE